LMPVLQRVISRVKREHGLSNVVAMFPTTPVLRQLPTHPDPGGEDVISRNGVKKACLWFVGGIPWRPGRAAGRCPKVNEDQVSNLRDRLKQQWAFASED
jgi:hypothetical protein